MTDVNSGRTGRPSKVDEHGTPTRERLLDAAVDVCVEMGYDGATLAEIARRADVSTPAIYNHFSDKASLLVAASQRHLNQVQSGNASSRRSVGEIVRVWTATDNSTMRKLSLELHVAAIRHPQVAALLTEWHSTNAVLQQEANGLSRVQVKMMYLLLMGLAHRDQIDLDVDDDELQREMARLVHVWLGD